MGQKDINEKTFIALNDVFADIFNVLVFGGKQLMKEEALSDQSPLSQYKADDELLHEQERDTFKLWHGHGVNLLLTIVLYFGEKLWKYPTSLKECFEPPLAEDEITNVLKKYIQDYQVHVFDIPRLSKEQVQMFQSDFRIVADYFTKVYTKDEYVPDDVVIQHVDEFLKLMKVLAKDKRFEEATRAIAEKEKEGLRMRSFFAESEARGEARGKEIGKEIGEARMGKLISLLLNQNLIEEAKRVTEDKEERERFYILYNI